MVCCLVFVYLEIFVFYILWTSVCCYIMVVLSFNIAMVLGFDITMGLGFDTIGDIFLDNTRQLILYYYEGSYFGEMSTLKCTSSQIVTVLELMGRGMKNSVEFPIYPKN